MQENHSARNCPLTPSNMKKILGRSKTTRSEEDFYKLCYAFTLAGGCNNVGPASSPSVGSFYTKLPRCPHIKYCQTFDQWSFQMLTSRINRMFAQRSLKALKLVIYFLPIGPFPKFIHDFQVGTAPSSLFALLCDFLQSFFGGSDVRLLPEIDISDISPTRRHHQLTGKLQYYVSDILTYLQKNLPVDGFAIIGLTWDDLYPSENLNFVLGQGSSQHSSCVSSFGRFDPNYVKGFKGKKTGVEVEDLKDIFEVNGEVIWKLLKVISHETCHVFGLSHCQVFECLMNESRSTDEALAQPLYLCPMCLSKIQHCKTSTRTVGETEKQTILDHFSSLLRFLRCVYCSENGVFCERATRTTQWLSEMVSYLAEDGK